MSARTNRIIPLLIVSFVLLTSAPTFAGRIIYVDDDAPADFTKIQAAINDANDSDEITVSIGTYFENIDFDGKNITLRSMEPLNPVVVANTIIDGRLGGSVVTFSGTESSACVLSGFTITNGRGTGVGYNYGGGIYGNGTSATIQNNIISGNRTASPLWPCSGFGGGLYDCDGTIQCNIISGNETACNEGAAAGGGLFGCDGTIQNNVISNNSALGFGGTSGGGLCGCNGNIQNNTIFGNLAGNYGGGLSGCNGTIINCIIWQNTADQGAQLDASATPSYCCIQDWTGGGSGNISDNPRLVEPESDDFHLQPDSPCIDIGNSIPVLTEDIEGDLRPLGSGYDIGADEFISDNFSPGKPTNIYPAKGATNISLTPTLSSSAFSDPDVGDSHQASQWHVWVSGTTWTVFGLTKSSGELLSITIPPRTLSDDINYSWRVRYQDNQGAWSYWSNPTEFTTEDTGEVVTVPGDYPTIQAAIDSTIYGDEIVISPGTYVENINFRGKNIILRSTYTLVPSIVAGTIIDGNQAGSVVTFLGDEPPSCILSGFTITNGNGSNSALEGAGTGGPYGGGIFGNGTLATIQNNVITANSAKSGAGLAGCHGAIQNNTISGNSAEGSYGGHGGGLYFCHGTIQNNVITSNSSTGGGPWGGVGGGLVNCDGTIQNNTINNNSADTCGGLLGCDGTIQNNIISSNSATWAHGGGFYQCHGTIQNNLICGNSAQGWGGGLYYCYATIRNNTICGNSGSYGGGVSRGGTIQNCILWGNTATTSGPQTYLVGSITYSCVEDSGGSTNIGIDPCFVDPNNSDYHLKSQAGRWDPKSQTWIHDDATSPCIDAGDPMSPIGYEPFPNSGIINMGAYGGTTEASKSYFDKPPCETIVAGDINGDCKVNFLDFRLMALHWLEDNSTPPPSP